MSETAKSQDDLSIEEILGSIRRIIAEDDDDVAPVKTQSDKPQPAAMSLDDGSDNDAFDADAEEPLELTNRIDPQEKDEPSLPDNNDAEMLVADDIAITDHIADPVDNPVADPVVDSEDEEEYNIKESAKETSVTETDNHSNDMQPEMPVAAAAPVQEETPAMTNQQDDANIKDNALLSSNTAIATAAVMAKLARQAAITEEGNNNLTLEAMVKEMIRPMLREWLDANLPELVQKMVERELERLTKRL